MYVLDTNILIYYFKGLGNVAQNLLNSSKQNIALPAIVIYEIETGIAKSSTPQKRKQQFETFLSHITILPFNLKEAREAAKIRAALEKEGHIIGPYDILIAGTAKANNATLVTHNISEFKRINNLKIIDWY